MFEIFFLFSLEKGSFFYKNCYLWMIPNPIFTH
jgi:hypothetical protein